VLKAAGDDISDGSIVWVRLDGLSSLPASVEWTTQEHTAVEFRSMLDEVTVDRILYMSN